MAILTTPRTSNYLRILLFCSILFICLAPFLGKAFHIDGPLFLWVAKHLQNTPLDFYGFTINWEGYSRPVSEIQQNPPLASYYIATMGYFLGWQEEALHSSFLFLSILCALGIYSLARQLCSSHLIAVFSAILTPAYLVSSTSIMSDLPMVTFWVWAVFFWTRGIREARTIDLFWGAFFITLSSLTKYYGISLVPLLAAYTLIEKRQLGRWCVYLSIPVFIGIGYQWLTYQMYGAGLVGNAVSYATNLRVGGGLTSKVMTTLSFCGGGIISSLLLFPALCPPRIKLKFFISSTAIFGVLILYLYFTGELKNDVPNGYIHFVQLYVFSLSSLFTVYLCFADLLRNRSSDSALLFLWVFGTMTFTCFFNWTVSIRNILPMVPAVSILIARQHDHIASFLKPKKHLLILGFIFCFASGSLVNYSDYTLANTAREAAIKIDKRYNGHSGTIWFQGHWGFQYYMELLGSRALDKRQPNLRSGDLVIVPSNNSYISPMDDKYFTYISSLAFQPTPWLTTMNAQTRAGFYSDGWGRLPFSIGKAPNELYHVYGYR